MWLSLFVVTGVAIGIIGIVNPRIMPTMISLNLIDTNLLRIVRPNTSFGGIIMARAMYFALFCLMIFVFSLSRWTVWLVFVMAAYRGFVTVVNLYWIVATIGMVMGFALFIVYLILFLLLIVLMIIVMIICIRECSWIRKGGFRCNLRWKDWQRHSIVCITTIISFAILEWIMYWLILSRFIYVVPPFV